MEETLDVAAMDLRDFQGRDDDGDGGGGDDDGLDSGDGGDLDGGLDAGDGRAEIMCEPKRVQGKGKECQRRLT
jgi:hypothetical protein